jgi:hypothetical protein
MAAFLFKLETAEGEATAGVDSRLVEPNETSVIRLA